MTARLLLILVLCVASASCRREERRLRETPVLSGRADEVRVSELRPGVSDIPPENRHPYQENAFAISEGKILFNAFNCSGCHANGGGGMGPPLMDDRWVYGSRPEQVFASIAQGRPNGMPSFAGKIPESQMWQLVAYVSSLGGMARADAASGRSDHLNAHAPDSQRDHHSRSTTGPAPGGR